MKQFFKFMFASMLGTVLSLLLVFFIFMGIIASIASFSKDKPVDVKANSILHLKLDHPIYDRAPNNPFESFDFTSFKTKKAFGLNSVLDQINQAMDDDNIKGIYLELAEMPASGANVREIREALQSFRESGKFVVAYADILTQKTYHLATVADKIYMNPEGYLDFKGLSASVMFYKGMLEKLDIDMQVIRGSDNKFKSAVEPLIADKMSPENREQISKLLNSLWSDVINDIATARGIGAEQLNNIADSLLIMNVSGAADYGLVDGLIYNDQMLDSLRLYSGMESGKKLRLVSLSAYSKAPAKDESLRDREKIAVIYASGEITGGDGDDKTIGSTRISKALRDVREDESIKAVVFRINSPGGSALASDIILREVELLAKEKPVIVSMGSLAASGGYYIACKATKIVANPNTITGSIGVFGVLPNMEKMLKNKAGITVDRVNTNTHSDYMSPLRAMDDYEFRRLQIEIDRIYDVFLKHVAEGRNMSIEKVDSIGQGRIWSGNDALNLGLVDELGGIKRAVELAVAEAGIENYRIIEYPKRKDPFQQLLEELTGSGNSEARIKSMMGRYYYIYEHAMAVERMSGVQTRMPFDLIIR